MKRELCNSETGWCLDGMFKMNYVYLVERYVLLDSQITVSTTLSKLHKKENVRIADLRYCAWIADENDSVPWVKFDLLQKYIVAGVLIRQKCDLMSGEQYVTMFDISSSKNDVTWVYIDTNIQPLYHNTYYTWWFSQEITARFLKVEILDFYKRAAMQADIIGRNA